jgi:hypothetical protein
MSLGRLSFLNVVGLIFVDWAAFCDAERRGAALDELVDEVVEDVVGDVVGDVVEDVGLVDFLAMGCVETLLVEGCLAEISRVRWLRLTS